MEAEVELHYPATGDFKSRFTVTRVTVSCFTELANLAYKMQMASGYRTRQILKPNGDSKTKVIGHAAEYVSFGPVIERDEDGLPARRERRQK